MRITSPGAGALSSTSGRWHDSIGKGMIAIIVLMVLGGSLASKGASRFLRHYYQTGDFRVSLSYAAGEYQVSSYFVNYSNISSLLKIPARLLRPTTAPTIVIDIKYKNIEKIYQKREEALTRGILVQEEDDFVSASIRSGDQTLKAKLRLKGDWVDHMVGDKMSFRVHMKGGMQLFGMRRFSLQHPRTRGYQAEPVFLETLRFFDVLAPRYLFVNVILNGNSLGVMAIEEHFSKELLEHQGRKESVIIRFDESLVWSHYDVTRVSGGPYYNFQNAPISAFQKSKIDQSETLRKDYATAVGLLRGFVERKLSASEVFDTDRLGSFLAVTDLWGGWHSLDWINMRFYFNPITLKLEPIGFDAELQMSHFLDEGRSTTRFPITVSMLDDPAVNAAYKQAARTLSSRLKDGSLMARLDRVERHHLDALQKEFVLLEPFDRDELNGRMQSVFGDIDSIRKTEYGRVENAIKTALADMGSGNDVDPETYPRKVHAYLIEDALDQPYLELASAIPHTVVIQDLQWVDMRNPARPLETDSTVSYPISLAPTNPGDVPQPVRIPLKRNPVASELELVVTGNLEGYTRNFQHRATRYHGALEQHPIPERLNTSHDFLVESEHGSRFSVSSGKWRVTEPIVLPEGALLHISKGTTLQFDAGAFLLVRGATDFQGSADDPIIFEGIPNDDRLPSWQGMVVLKAAEKSQWSHVFVRNTTGISYGPWRLTGGVTFYYSDIEMTACDFTGNRGEDALNIVHARFDLNDVRITETASDGFDGDFTTGSITGGVFQDIGQIGGGDAFDLSGSEVSMQNTRFIRINDKALSVGEKSKLTVRGLTIEDVGTGAASKDMSQLDISESTIRGARVAGLLAYIKKPEYGPAQLTATDTAILESEISAKVQSGSVLHLNGELIETEALNVDALYETVMKRGGR